METPLKPESFRDLVATGAMTSASIVGRTGGYVVVAGIGKQQRPLGTRQGDVRVFSTADTAIKFLRGLGVHRATLDTARLKPGHVRPRRPDAARRNRDATAALEHDRWFREQVQATLDRLAAGEEKLIPHDQFWDGIEQYARGLDAKGL